jgi:PAS domain S-box-containing protein
MNESRQQINLVDGRYGIEDLVNIGELQDLFEKFTAATGFSIGFMDHPGLNLLIQSGWQPLCTQFHRANPASEAFCVQCNRQLLNRLDVSGKAVFESCGHGLVDCAIPVMIEGKHLASLVMGQVFFAPPDINQYKQRASQYGFNEKDYLDALAKVPVLEKDRFNGIVAFFENMTRFIVKLGQTRLAALRDTEQKAAEILKYHQTEEAYLDALSMLKGTLEATDNGILVVSEYGKTLHANHRFAQMWHIPQEIVESGDEKTMLQYVLEQLVEPQRFLDGVESLYASPDAEAFDVLNFKDGRVFERASLPMMRHGLPAGRVWSFRDITGRKQMEDELRESGERLSMALGVSKAGIWEWNLINDTVHFDAQFHAILGYEAGELPVTLRQWTTYHHPDDTVIMFSRANNYLEGKSPIYESEHRIRSKTGEWAWVLTRGQLVKFADTGKRDLFMGIAINVTERKRVEEELSQHRHHLEDLVSQRTAELSTMNQELDAFSYSVSHDLRAPLRSMYGFSQALMEDYGDKLDDEGKNYLSRIKAASQRMGQLIDDLLNLSRISRSEFHSESVNLSELAKTIVDVLCRAQPDREADVVIQEGLMVKGDQHLLMIALENLLGNAWKFTSRQVRGRIEFGKTCLDGKDVYFVEDNGTGFNMAYAGKLFSPFQRLHSEKDFPGSGIGLSTVQRIILRHGGDIWANAEEGKGATFYFTLPQKI